MPQGPAHPEHHCFACFFIALMCQKRKKKKKKVWSCKAVFT